MAVDDSGAEANRRSRLLIGLLLLTAVVELRHEIAHVPGDLAGFCSWFDPDSQQRLALGADDELLRRADRLLPRGASVLLLTAGRDVRHREYTTFHRALYWLTPRPVWWLTPAPTDATWESRWWISAPLTREAILSVATARGATHLLAVDLGEPPPVGAKVADLPGGAIFSLASAESLEASASLIRSTAEPDRLSSLWALRLIAALLTIGMLGACILAAIVRVGLDTVRIERAALVWILGAGATSIAMLWLNAAGATLGQQVAIISLSALGAFVFVRVTGARPHAAPSRAGLAAAERVAVPAASRALSLLSVGLITACVLLVTLAAVGRPLAVWDSWVLWGMRARAMFVAGGITPVIYGDPSRTVTLPHYPLLLPLLEAWVYAWLGGADDRLAGAVSVAFFAALPAVVYAALRRRGGDRDFALLASATLAAVPPLVGLAGSVLADLPVALFTTVAAVYLVDWLERGQAGPLVVAALSAGFLPWTKREGVVLVVALAVATLIAGRACRRAWLGALALCGSAALLSGPWYVFVALHGLSDPQFDPLTLARFVGNLDRLPSIGWRALATLASPAGGWVWPAAGIFVIACRSPGAAARPSALFPLTGCLYVLAMAWVYFFSAYVPYQQHMLSSFPRLVAQVAALPVLWIAYHATPKP